MSNNRKYLLISALAFLIFSLGFGIGYLIAKESSPAPIIIEKNS